MTRAHGARRGDQPADDAFAAVARGFAQRDRQYDGFVSPDQQGTCLAVWGQLLADPPVKACTHHAATCNEGQPGPWFALASDAPPVRRCAACLPVDMLAVLSAPTLGGRPPVRRCDCCGLSRERVAVSVVRGVAVLPGQVRAHGTILAELCGTCWTEQQRDTLAGRAS